MGKTATNFRKVIPAKKTNSVKSTTKASGKTSLKPGEDKILQAMGKLKAACIGEPKRDEVQNFSGNGKTPEGFKKTVGKLKKDGYIDYASSDTLALTDKGQAYVGHVDPSSFSVVEFHANIKGILPNKQAKQIFDMLTDGNKHSKDELIDGLDLDRAKLSGFEKNLSKMKSLGYLDKTKGEAWLTGKCFPASRTISSYV